MLENRYAHYTLIVEHRLHACTLILEQYILFAVIAPSLVH